MKQITKILGGKWLWIAVFGVLGLEIWLFAPACRFSALAVWGLGGILLCYRLLEYLGKKYPKGARRLRRIFTVCLCLLLLAMIVTEAFILRAGRGAKENDSPYLLVLGAGVDGSTPSLTLTERLAAALSYLNAHPDTVCIVSGGQGDGENLTEAECMFRWLVDHGIEPERIIQEDKATSTAENLAFSLAILRERGEEPTSLAVVSSEYHLFRAGLMAERQGIEFLGVPARTSLPLLRANYFLREIFGVWHFMIFGK